jgi:hypothetical protein
LKLIPAPSLAVGEANRLAVGEANRLTVGEASRRKFRDELNFLCLLRERSGSNPKAGLEQSIVVRFGCHHGAADMRHLRPPTTRNKIDVTDAGQIRVLKRRLGISSDDLHRVVAKVGNSIAAVTKEIESQRPLPLTVPAPVQSDPAPSAIEVTASV